MTVEKALQIFPFSEGKLVAGMNGVTRLIKSLNVIDAPDISDWVKEGEMLFTTAYVIKDSVDDAISLLRKLNQRHSAGLGIKLGRFWDAVPASMVEEADRLGFPLIELPYQYTFSDQMNALLQAEFKRSTLELQSVVDKQKQLMQVALQRGSIHLDAISSIVGYPMAVIGARGHLIYNTTGYAEAELLHGWPWKIRVHLAHLHRHPYYRVPLMQGEECIGCVLFFPIAAYVEKVEEGLFVQAAEMISHQLNLPYSQFAQRSVTEDFSFTLLRYLNEGLPIQELEACVERLGLEFWKSGGGYQCLLTHFSASLHADEKNRTMRAVWEELHHRPALKQYNGLNAWLENGVFSIFPVLGSSEEAELHEQLKECLSSLNKDDARPSVQVAVSHIKSLPRSLKEAYEECVHAIRLAEELGLQSPILSYENMEFALIFQHVPKEMMERYCDRVLAGLANKEQDYAKDMIHTLKMYIDSDGQLNETARRLFVHRNTAAYRIDKLSEILDVDFKKINDVFRLKVAILFKRMMKDEGWM
ncbi:PucR family transcriptional regulator [Bacillus sp. FJAT-27264]|uniref:PucR family transcriptional regulator n=1 Tax=Paenibacillus sp. (strain DSM 101736 / FJAT-27264) TaxID=1850362 RepID=UPI001586D2EE|nr:PucR family transcriptional regulator [Bacillus sp. FJAT-27264]